MVEETERERVFLAKKLPKDLKRRRHILIKVGDFFDSNKVDALKIKQKGNQYALIKKKGKTALRRTEDAILIKKGEFDVLWDSTVQNHEKTRYFYAMGSHTCEIDLYHGRLSGYVRVEIEFKNAKVMKSFVPHPWLGDEITRWNHSIHKNLGIVTFAEMKKRYLQKGIKLKKVFLV